MTLEDLGLKIPVVEQGSRVKNLIQEANQRIDDFVHGRGTSPLVGFVPSDFDEVYSALHAISRIRSGYFVEWGSGFGVATLLASELGFEAGGIEIQPDLVEEAERLATDFELDAEFVVASYVPPDAQDLIDLTEGPEWLEHGGQDGHGLLDIDPSDVDVVFAYPWPGEAEVIEALFERLTEPGAILFTWNGLDGMRILVHASQCD